MVLKRLTFLAGVSLLLCGSASQCWADTYYVASGVTTTSDPTLLSVQPAAGAYNGTAPAGDDSFEGTIARPFKTIQAAANKAVAGDTVIVRNGKYSETVAIGYFPNWKSWRNSTTGTDPTPAYPDGRRIVFKAENRGRAWVRSSSYYGGCFNINSAEAYGDRLAYKPAIDFATLRSELAAIGKPVVGYITIEGFDLQSTGYEGMGIALGWVHHVTIVNNKIHDSGLGGIGTGACDYIKVEGNEVYNNCRTSNSNSSGISFHTTVPYDTQPGNHNLIDKNTVAENHIDYNATTVPNGTQYIGHTDGNGIIMDICPYNLGTLIQNNLVINNGGVGILMNGASNIKVINNTCYNNNSDVRMDEQTYNTKRSEIVTQQTVWVTDRDQNGVVITPEVRTSANPLNTINKNITIWNNICYPRPNYTSTYYIYSGPGIRKRDGSNNLIPQQVNRLHEFYGIDVQDTTTNSAIQNNWLFKQEWSGNVLTDRTSGLLRKSARATSTSFPEDYNFPGSSIGIDNRTTVASNNGDVSSAPSSNPLFKSITTRYSEDCRLQSASPCRWSSWGTMERDCDYWLRRSQYHDLGAFEYH